LGFGYHKYQLYIPSGNFNIGDLSRRFKERPDSIGCERYSVDY
jgi:hypothetical protein